MAKSRSRSRRPVKSVTPAEEVVTKEVVNEEVAEVATDIEEVTPEVNEEVELTEEEVEESVTEEKPYRIADEVKKSNRRFSAGESKDRIMDALENAVKVAREEKELAQAAGRSYRVYHMVAHRCVILIENVKRMLR